MAGNFWRSCMIGKVYKDDNVIYHGDILSWDRYIDWEAAHEYYEKLEKGEVEHIHFSAFWEKKTIKLPKLPPKDIKQANNISAIRYGEVVYLATNLLILDDRIVNFRNRFFKEYDLYEYQNRIWQREKNKKEKKINIDSIMWIDGTMPTFYKKEFLEWLYRLDPLYIQWQQQGIAITKEYSDGKLHGVYTDVMRQLMFKDMSSFSERLSRPMSNLQYHLIHHIGQETWIAGARKTAKTSWAVWEIILNSIKHNKSRRPIRIAWIGLSEEAVDSAKMYLKMETEFMMDIGMVDEKKTDQTFYVKEVIETKTRDRKWKEKVVSEIKVKYVSKWKMEKKASLGWVYDLIVVDEAELIIKWYYESLMSLVQQEKSKIIFLMNFNREGKKTFAYYKFIQAEKEEFERIANGQDVDSIVNEIWDREWLGGYDSLEQILEEKDMKKITQELRWRRKLVWLRYSIHDNDMLTRKEIEDTCKFFMETNYVTYLTHYECVMPNEASIFDLSAIRVEREALRYDFLFFSYDPSINSEDPSALSVYWYSQDPSHPFYNQVIGLEEIHINGSSIKNQIPSVKINLDNSLNRYVKEWRDVMSSYMFLFDPNGIWQSVRDYLLWVGINRSFWIHVIGNGESEVEEKKILRVNKEKFVKTLQSAIGDWLIYIYSNMKETFRQMTVFQEQETPSGGITYNAPQGDHDDFVTCIWMVSYFCTEKWIKHRLLMNNIRDINDSLDERLREEDPLQWEIKKQEEERLRKKIKQNVKNHRKRNRKYLY